MLKHSEMNSKHLPAHSCSAAMKYLFGKAEGNEAMLLNTSIFLKDT
jgi:hypothetical protein